MITKNTPSYNSCKYIKEDIYTDQATITTRVDANGKTNFDAFCFNVELNTSMAINIFVKAVLRENRIPFETIQAPDLFFSDINIIM